MSESSAESIVAKSARILVVEDDSFIRKALVATLAANGYQIRDAMNGLVAKTIWDLGRDFDLIISDIRMPELDGVALLRHVRQDDSKIPFILMTGFTELLEADEAYRIGASEFVTKPFRPGDLLDAISACLNPKPLEVPVPQTVESKPPEFCAIHINEFLTTTRLLSDIYIKLSNTKYVRVAYQGEEIPVERLRTYLAKRADFLYVTFADFGKYVDFSMKITSAAVANRNISSHKKARLLKHATEVLVGKCFLNDLDGDFVQPAQKMVENALNLATEDVDIVEVFSDLSTQSERLFAQGVAVAVYSCLVARQHGWTSASTLFKLVLGGLLHDIGCREINPSILRKRRILRSAEETQLVESHPTRGRDLVLMLNKLPEDVSTIVFQHHELPNGTGFPLGLSAKDIHPLALLIGTVDRFVNLVAPLEDGAAPLDPRDALAKLKSQHTGGPDGIFLEHLIRLFDSKIKAGAV